METHDPLNNNLEISTPFKYPEEFTPEEVADDIAGSKLKEMLTRMAIYVIPAKDPRITLVALFYAAGIDLSFILNCPNTEIDIAKKLGVSRQSMSLYVKRARKDFNLNHSSTIDYGKTPEVYKKANYKRIDCTRIPAAPKRRT